MFINPVAASNTFPVLKSQQDVEADRAQKWKESTGIGEFRYVSCDNLNRLVECNAEGKTRTGAKKERQFKKILSVSAPALSLQQEHEGVALPESTPSSGPSRPRSSSALHASMPSSEPSTPQSSSVVSYDACRSNYNVLFRRDSDGRAFAYPEEKPERHEIPEYVSPEHLKYGQGDVIFESIRKVDNAFVRLVRVSTNYWIWQTFVDPKPQYRKYETHKNSHGVLYRNIEDLEKPVMAYSSKERKMVCAVPKYVSIEDLKHGEGDVIFEAIHRETRMPVRLKVNDENNSEPFWEVQQTSGSRSRGFSESAEKALEMLANFRTNWGATETSDTFFAPASMGTSRDPSQDVALSEQSGASIRREGSNLSSSAQLEAQMSRNFAAFESSLNSFQGVLRSQEPHSHARPLAPECSKPCKEVPQPQSGGGSGDLSRPAAEVGLEVKNSIWTAPSIDKPKLFPEAQEDMRVFDNNESCPPGKVVVTRRKIPVSDYRPAAEVVLEVSESSKLGQVKRVRRKIEE